LFGIRGPKTVEIGKMFVVGSWKNSSPLPLDFLDFGQKKQIN
jgi:hypothetical protein